MLGNLICPMLWHWPWFADTRYIMTTAMSGSLMVLFWSFVWLSLSWIQWSSPRCTFKGLIMSQWHFNGSLLHLASQHLRLLLVVQTTMALSLTQILAGFFKNSDIPAAWFAICCAYNGVSSQNVFRSVRRQCYWYWFQTFDCEPHWGCQKAGSLSILWHRF